MTKVIEVLVAASLATFSIAAGSSETTPLDRTITRIDVLKGSALIHFSPEYDNEQGCTKTSKTIAVLREVDVYPEIFSGLLSAMHAKSFVTLGLDGCGGGSYDYPKIYRVGIEP